MNNKKAGLAGLRSTLPNLQPIEPTESVPDVKTVPKPVTGRKRVKAQDPLYLPKTIRVAKDTHRAISTIAMLNDKPIYEVIDILLNKYIDDLDPVQRKLIKKNVDDDMR